MADPEGTPTSILSQVHGVIPYPHQVTIRVPSRDCFRTHTVLYLPEWDFKTVLRTRFEQASLPHQWYWPALWTLTESYPLTISLEELQEARHLYRQRLRNHNVDL